MAKSHKSQSKSHMESGSVHQIQPTQELSTAVGKTFAEGVHFLRLRNCSGHKSHDSADSAPLPCSFLVLCQGSIFGYDGLPVRRQRLPATDWKSVVQRLPLRTGSPSYKYNSTPTLKVDRALDWSLEFERLSAGCHSSRSVKSGQGPFADFPSKRSHLAAF